MKKFFGILFTCLIFASCKNFLSDNQSILDKLREEVKVNTAPEIAGVTFSQPKSIDGSSQIGTISLVGNASVLVDVKFRIELEINPKDGYFNEWQAFLRDKDGLKPVEGTDLIEFTQINTNPADVVIKKQVDNLVIGAKINYTPSVSIASPDYGTSSISGVAKMLDGETLPVVFNSEQYGLSVFKISYRDMANSAIQSFDLKEMPEYTEKLELKKEDGTLLYTLHNFRINKALSNLSFVIEPADTLDDIYSLSVDTEKRSEIRETDPINGKEGLMRTTPIKIRFSSDMDCSQITEENFRDYVTVERVVIDETTSEETLYDCFADEGNKLDENRTRCYFNIPEFASDKKTLLITPQNKTKESEWLPSGSTIRVTVKDNLRNQEGIPLLQDHTFSFSLGTKGDAEGPIITKDKTKLSIYSSKKNIDQSEWGDFEPAKNPVMGHTYVDSIHVGPREKFKVNIQATDVNTGDTGIKDFVADIRLMYVYEGGRLPNSSEKASKNLILFDKDGDWLYEAGYLKQDFNKEYTVPYTGTNKMAETGSNFLIDFEDFKTENSLSVDGIYRIELTARDMLENYASNSNVYYVVRDTTPPDAEKNAAKITLGSCGFIENDENYFFGNNYSSIIFNFNGEIIDNGVQLLPNVSSKNNKWSVALSKSNTDKPDSGWSDFKSNNDSIEFSLDNFITENETDDFVLYPWVVLKDEFNSISEPDVLNIPLVVDITNPVCPLFSETNVDNIYVDYSNNVVYINETQALIDFYIPQTSDIKHSSKETIVLKKGDVIIEPDENGLYKIENGESYSLSAIDSVGNVSDVFTFSTIKDSNKPIITDVIINNDKNSIQRNFYQKNSYGSYTNVYKTYGNGESFSFDTSGKTNGDVFLSFKVSENETSLIENGISFEGITISKYSIGESGYFFELPENKNYIPINNNFECKNTLFSVRGKLTDLNSDGEKNITIKVSDGVNIGTFSTSIELISEIPELKLTFYGSDYIYNEEKNIVYTKYKPDRILQGSSSLGSYPVVSFTASLLAENVYFIASDESFMGKFNIGIGNNSPSYDNVYQLNLLPKSNDRYVDYRYYFPPTSTPEILITGFDQFGNSSSKTLTCIYDNTPPVFQILKDPINDKYWIKGDEKVECKIFDEKVGIKSYMISCDYEVYYGESEDIIFLGDETKGLGTEYTYEIIDKFGNTKSGSFIVQLDNIGPQFFDINIKGVNKYDSDEETLVSDYYKNNIYVEFKIEDVDSEINLNSLIIPKQNVLKYFVSNTTSEDPVWVEPDSSNVHSIPLSENTKSTAYVKAYLSASSADSSVLVFCEDNAGKSSFIKKSLIYDGDGPAINGKTDYKLKVINGGTPSQNTSAQVILFANESSETFLEIPNCDAGCGLAKVVLAVSDSRGNLSNVKTVEYAGTYPLMVGLGTGKEVYDYNYIKFYDFLGTDHDSYHREAYSDVSLTIKPNHLIFNGKDQNFSTYFTNSSSYPWGTERTIKDNNYYYYLKSGGKGIDDMTSELTTKKSYNCKHISFYYKLSSEQRYDKFMVSSKDSSNNTENILIDSGEKDDWIYFSKTFDSTAYRTFTFSYLKDESDSNGDDCVLIDRIIIE